VCARGDMPDGSGTDNAPITHIGTGKPAAKEQLQRSWHPTNTP